MNLQDDPGTSRYSPYYQGDVCKSCGKREDTNENGECSECETKPCFLCKEPKTNKELRTVMNRDVCTECIDYEGINAVRDIIRRHDMKIERGKKMLSALTGEKVQSFIKENFKPSLTH